MEQRELLIKYIQIDRYNKGGELETTKLIAMINHAVDIVLNNFPQNWDEYQKYGRRSRGGTEQDRAILDRCHRLIETFRLRLSMCSDTEWSAYPEVRLGEIANIFGDREELTREDSAFYRLRTGYTIVGKLSPDMLSYRNIAFELKKIDGLVALQAAAKRRSLVAGKITALYREKDHSSIAHLASKLAEIALEYFTSDKRGTFRVDISPSALWSGSMAKPLRPDLKLYTPEIDAFWQLFNELYQFEGLVPMSDDMWRDLNNQYEAMGKAIRGKRYFQAVVDHSFEARTNKQAITPEIQMNEVVNAQMIMLNASLRLIHKFLGNFKRHQSQWTGGLSFAATSDAGALSFAEDLGGGLGLAPSEGE